MPDFDIKPDLAYFDLDQTYSLLFSYACHSKIWQELSRYFPENSCLVQSYRGKPCLWDTFTIWKFPKFYSYLKFLALAIQPIAGSFITELGEVSGARYEDSLDFGSQEISLPLDLGLKDVKALEVSLPPNLDSTKQNYVSFVWYYFDMYENWPDTGGYFNLETQWATYSAKYQKVYLQTEPQIITLHIPNFEPFSMTISSSVPGLGETLLESLADYYRSDKLAEYLSLIGTEISANFPRINRIVSGLSCEAKATLSPIVWNFDFRLGIKIDDSYNRPISLNYSDLPSWWHKVRLVWANNSLGDSPISEPDLGEPLIFSLQSTSSGSIINCGHFPLDYSKIIYPYTNNPMWFGTYHTSQYGHYYFRDSLDNIIGYEQIEYEGSPESGLENIYFGINVWGRDRSNYSYDHVFYSYLNEPNPTVRLTYSWNPSEGRLIRIIKGLNPW